MLLISVPKAPSQASVTTIMETSLQVSWSQSDPLDLVLQYMVQVKPGAGDWEQVNDTIKGSSVLVTNLNAFTAYSFRVNAKNGLGSSPYSQPSPNVTTLEGGMRKIVLEIILHYKSLRNLSCSMQFLAVSKFPHLVSSERELKSLGNTIGKTLNFS